MKADACSAEKVEEIVDMGLHQLRQGVRLAVMQWKQDLQALPETLKCNSLGELLWKLREAEQASGDGKAPLFKIGDNVEVNWWESQEWFRGIVVKEVDYQNNVTIKFDDHLGFEGYFFFQECCIRHAANPEEN